jgi:hypothetical protein
MLRHSPAAARALAFLKRPYNDIDIFVEDTGNHNMWLAIVRKIIPPRIRLTSVNLLGGKQSVIAACKLDQVIDGRRKLYIIDGDFDIILRRKKPRLKHLYRIRAYCIENLLINEAAAINVGLIFRPTWDEQRVRAELQFETTVGLAYKRLAPLFQIYAVAYSVDPSIRTIGNPVTSLYLSVNEGIEICPKKVAIVARQVARRVRAVVGYQGWFRQIEEVRQSAAGMPYQCWISGKNYIFPLFKLILKKRVAAVCDSEQLKVLLANSWTDFNEPRLAHRLRMIC